MLIWVLCMLLRGIALLALREYRIWQMLCCWRWRNQRHTLPIPRESERCCVIDTEWIYDILCYWHLGNLRETDGTRETMCYWYWENQRDAMLLKTRRESERCCVLTLRKCYVIGAYFWYWENQRDAMLLKTLRESERCCILTLAEYERCYVIGA